MNWHFGHLPRNTCDQQLYIFAMGPLVSCLLPAITDSEQRRAFFKFVSPCRIQGKYFYCIINYNQEIDIKNLYNDAILWAFHNFKDIDTISFIICGLFKNLTYLESETEK